MQVEKVGICLPKGLRARAKERGVNISHASAEGIISAVKRNKTAVKMDRELDQLLKNETVSEAARKDK